MKKASPKSTTTAESKTLVVLGLDETEKPRAARFTTANPKLVAKAAEAMALRLVEITTDEHADLVNKLPTGRLYSNGKGFVPFVRRDLYLKLATALGIVATAEPATPPVLPKNWEDIGVGALVLAAETPADYGWWEAVVVQRDGDILTLRWRDYPKEPTVTRHSSAVALLNADTAQ